MLVAAAFLGLSLDASAQYGRTKKAPDKSQAASASQTIGVNSKVSVDYHRPKVKGREIWGTKLANYGTPAWRAGANETTAVTFSDDVTVNGKAIPAGTYGLHIVLSEDKWTFIFNKNYKTWGTFQYKADADVARVEVSSSDAPHQEELLFGFENLKDNGADMFVHWEKKKASVTVDLKK
jgi:hypothetical protein